MNEEANTWFARCLNGRKEVSALRSALAYIHAANQFTLTHIRLARQPTRSLQWNNAEWWCEKCPM